MSKKLYKIIVFIIILVLVISGLAASIAPFLM